MVLGDLARGMVGFHFDLIPFFVFGSKENFIFRGKCGQEEEKRKQKKKIYDFLCNQYHSQSCPYFYDS